MQLRVFGQFLELHDIINGIILTFFNIWEIKHIFKEANIVADCIANVGHFISENMYIDRSDFNSLLSILVMTTLELGVTLVRN